MGADAEQGNEPPPPPPDLVTRSLEIIAGPRTGRLVAAAEQRAAQLAPGPVVLTYVGVIAVAELLTALGAVVPGAIYHAVLIPILLTHYVLAQPSRYGRILPVLALFPLLRILSWTMPIKQVPYIYWYALVSIPLLVAVALTVRLLALSGRAIGLCIPSWPRELFIAFLGLPLSALAFLLLHPTPIMANPAWPDYAIGAAILLVGTGFTEELLFRGLLQPVAVAILGRMGFFCSIALFTIMYLGAPSWGYTLFIGVVGWLFSWCVGRTQSIAGVTVAHGILNIGLLLVWPQLAAQPGLESWLFPLSVILLAGWLLAALALRFLAPPTPRIGRPGPPPVPSPLAEPEGGEPVVAVPLRLAPVAAPPQRGRRLALPLAGGVVLLLAAVGLQGAGVLSGNRGSLGNAFAPRLAGPTPAAGPTIPAATPSVGAAPPATAGGPLPEGRLDLVTLPYGNFTGGFTAPDTLYRSQPARLLFGQDTSFNAVQASFVVDTPAGTAIHQARLLLHGVDSEDAAKTPLRIVINGTPIFEGADPLPNDYNTQTGARNWGLFTWEIAPGVLRPGANTLTMTNLDASPEPRFIAFDYALIAWLQGP